MSSIPDFSEVELKLVKDTLKERFNEAIDPAIVDVELRIYPDDRELTECPALYWEHKDCNFILAKTADSEFYTQFFYGNREHFGTGRERYDDLHNCIVTLLQVQADHERSRNMQKENKD
ncbi:MAG: hypothetical protein OEY89_13595 [Gammaproteobacteria bacterium]|nr:hypothetical protein [Gammaproteobacteria bacterium]